MPASRRLRCGAFRPATALGAVSHGRGLRSCGQRQRCSPRLGPCAVRPDSRGRRRLRRQGARPVRAPSRTSPDAELSRRIGGWLGNDIGQMRIPFNPKPYVDRAGLSRRQFRLLGSAAAAAGPAGRGLETAHRRGDRPESSRGRRRGRRRGARRARPADAERGIVVARYPEWDRAARQERADWTTVREIAPVLAPAHPLEQALARDPGLIARIDRLVRAARVGRPTRLKRQPDGIDLDLDAAVDAAKALRTWRDARRAHSSAQGSAPAAISP